MRLLDMGRFVRMKHAAERRSGLPVVLPDGTVSTEHTPEVTRILNKLRSTWEGRERAAWDKASGLARLVAQDDSHARMLATALDDVQLARAVKEGANYDLFVGDLEITPGQVIIHTPSFPTQTLVDAYDAHINAIIEEEERRNYLMAPPHFMFEPGLVSEEKWGQKLTSLLDPENYSPQEEWQHVMISNMARLHKRKDMTVRYYLREDGMRFSVEAKYISKGFRRDGTRDKFDVVVRVYEDGEVEPRHYEANTAVANAVMKDYVDEFITEGGVIIPGGIIVDDETVESIRSKIPDSWQVKTDGEDDDRQRIEIERGDTRVVHDYEFRDTRNYDQFCDDPSILGGHPLGRVIDHIRENMPSLRLIYMKRMSP